MACEIVINGLPLNGNFNFVNEFSTLVGPQHGTSEYELALEGF